MFEPVLKQEQIRIKYVENHNHDASSFLPSSVVPRFNIFWPLNRDSFNNRESETIRTLQQ